MMRVLLILFLLAFPLFAADYELFLPNGRFHPEYAQRVARLRQGDRVFFSDGSFYELGERLGKGTLDVIFRISSTHAIRLAQTPWSENVMTPDSITEFVEGNRALKKAGVPVVEVDVRSSSRGEFAIMESLNIRKGYSDFTAELARNPHDPQLRAEFELLKEFSRKSAMVSNVQDLHGKNLVLTDKGWLAIDYLSSIRPYRGHNIGQIKPFHYLTRKRDFKALFESDSLKYATSAMPEGFRRELNETVNRERERRADRWHRFSTSCYILTRLVLPFLD